MDLFVNRELKLELNEFIATDFNGTVKMKNIKNNLFKIKYNKNEVVFLIDYVYDCRTRKYPDFLIDFKEVETLQISKSKDSDRFSFQYNGKCLEVKTTLRN